MRAGNTRHQITIQNAVETRGADGSVVKTWATFLQTWGDIRPKDATEKYAARGIDATVMHEIRIRYYPGITPAMRVIHSSRTFEIVGIVNFEERNREMLLICQERV